MNFQNPHTKLHISEKSVVSKSVIFGKNCQTVTIGYGCYIGENVYIDVPNLNIGDYTTIHKNTTIHGTENCSIGHNCWIGQNCIIDSIGGMTIMNNVGIGTYSQLWSHMKFGDILNGCRWHNKKPMLIEDDVWIVGHCLVSPIHAKKGSMAMLGSLVTRDMETNSIYAGTPAKNMTDRLGNQFQEVTLDSKCQLFKKYYDEFTSLENIDESLFQYDAINEYEINVGGTLFNLLERTYFPTRSEIEYRFIKYMLYEKAKFIPIL